MVIILLSIACITNSVAIILHLVVLLRENLRKGFGGSYADLERATEIQRYMNNVVDTSEAFIEKFNHLYNDR